MPKSRPNEQLFEDGDTSIRLVADFGFLSAVNYMGRDVSLIFADLSNGLMPPDDVRNVIMCAAVDVEEGGKEAFVEDLISRYGLQEIAIMARLLLSHGMIGDVKKSALGRLETVQGILDKLIPFRSTTFIKAGLLWVATVAISTSLACLIFKYTGWFI